MASVDWTKLSVAELLDPKGHGYTMCTHCTGYGSSLKESSSRCTKCKGTGLITQEKRRKKNGR